MRHCTLFFSLTTLTAPSKIAHSLSTSQICSQRYNSQSHYVICFAVGIFLMSSHLQGSLCCVGASIQLFLGICVIQQDSFNKLWAKDNLQQMHQLHGFQVIFIMMEMSFQRTFQFYHCRMRQLGQTVNVFLLWDIIYFFLGILMSIVAIRSLFLEDAP